LVPNEEELPHMCGQENRAAKEAWEGRGPVEQRCDVAQAVVLVLCLVREKCNSNIEWSTEIKNKFFFLTVVCLKTALEVQYLVGYYNHAFAKVSPKGATDFHTQLCYVM
jgi:hypothetical protein